MRSMKRAVAGLLVVCMAGMGLPLPVQAGMVSTERAITPAQVRELSAMLDRADVRAQLERYGVAADEVKARVSALTEEEAARLAERIDELPAGGGVLGVLFTVFVILLITDILGLTKVFPFTRAACDRGRC